MHCLQAALFSKLHAGFRNKAAHKRGIVGTNQQHVAVLHHHIVFKPVDDGRFTRRQAHNILAATRKHGLALTCHDIAVGIFAPRLIEVGPVTNITPTERAGLHHDISATLQNAKVYAARQLRREVLVYKHRFLFFGELCAAPL